MKKRFRTKTNPYLIQTCIYPTEHKTARSHSILLSYICNIHKTSY